MPAHSLIVAFSYLFGALLLGVYGVEVCPFIDGIGYGMVLPNLFVSFLVAFVIRVALYRLPRSWGDLIFYREFSAWIAAGATITIYNALALNFPVASGLKVCVGFLAIGIPLSTLVDLLTERDDILGGRSCTERLSPTGPRQSIASRLSRFVTASQILLAVVLILLIIKDITEINEMLKSGTQLPVRLILIEIGGAFFVMLALNSLVTAQYSRNLDLLLENQLSGMNAVAHGKLDIIVPVIANNELSIIGDRTNTVVETLRERERIKSAFGKMLSPQVANAVLAIENGQTLGGRDVEAVVLFSDLRNFTAITENLEPRQVVAFLNEYFSMVVDAIHSENGVVDKFIGDAVMAIFGLEGDECPPDAADRAMSAALAMREGLTDVNARLSQQGLPVVANGIGLHIGRMVAGNIGSADRLEYTVIGDTVNTASRLEGLCRTTNTPLIVSAAFYAQLSEAYRAHLQPVGEFPVKGKTEPISVFGITQSNVS